MEKVNKVLIMNVPHIPSYFNAGHRLCIFETGAFLRQHFNLQVDCMDVAALNITWKELSDKIFSNSYDVIAIMLDFDTVDNLERLLYYIKHLLPNVRIILFGRLCKQIPKFFRRFEVNAIAFSGDNEFAVANYLSFLNGGTQIPAGCHIKADTQWFEGAEGKFLEASEWVFPDYQEIPYQDYSRLYVNDSNKFCGIPNKKELVVHVSRGCPIGCSYCDVPKMQGIIERRISVEKLYNYIMRTMPLGEFDYISMYSPIFTLNKKWTENFCRLMMAGQVKYPWKCVSTIKHLSPSLIELMAEAKCIRISIGVENVINNNEIEVLPACKQHVESCLKIIADSCKKFGVELNCFIMLGIPGVSIKDTLATVRLLEDYGARIRPTIYTRYQDLNDNTKKILHDLSKYNRQIFRENSSSNNELYRILYGGILGNTLLDKTF